MISIVARELRHPYIPATLPQIHPDISLIQAGSELGNVDPRFSQESDVDARRNLIRTAMPSLDDIYVIKPLSEADFVDIDREDDRIGRHPLLKEIEVNADAMITNRPRIGLMANTADCIPLVVAQPDRNILSMIHVGWKGAMHRIHENVMNYAKEEYGFDPRGSVAYLGASVQKENFKLKWLHEIHESDPEWQPYVQEGDEGFHIDIPGFVIATLKKYGLRDENIVANPVDTGHPDSGYFSYERHKRNPDKVPNGRNAFMAALA